MSIFKRGPNKLERLQAAARLQEAMERTREPPRIYTPEGTPVMTHYKRPDADTPLCPLGRWKVPWTVARTEAEIAFAAVLKLCDDCQHIHAGQDSAGAAS